MINHNLGAVLCFVLLCFIAPAKADVIGISDSSLSQPLALNPYLTAYTDTSGGIGITADAAYLRAGQFIPRSALELARPDQPFWLRASLQTDSNLRRNHLSIHFQNLTYVDLHIFRDGQEIIHRQAGAFRKKRFIAPEDDRFNFHIALLPGHTYTLLFRVHHINKYQPDAAFIVQDQFAYQKAQRITASANYLLLGAIGILSCYCLLSFVIIRYRPYLWTFLFLTGIGGFSFSLHADFIDFFFPNQPETGWLLVQPFVHLGVIGFYLLVLNLLRTKAQSHRLHQAGRLLILLLIAFDLFSLFNKGVASNYYQTNRYHLLFVFVHVAYLSWALAFLWKRLDAAQRYWGYGILLFAMATIFTVVVSVTLRENSYSILSIGLKAIALAISILFLTGINRQQKRYEQEKIQALQRLNDLQQQHTVLVEKKVTERTEQLAHTNQQLKQQQELLLQKNEHIETLMDELSHRVKNNLQTLYSLNTLQLPKVKDRMGKRVLNDTRARIKSMMLVNEYLLNLETSKTISSATFIADIVCQVRQIYDQHNDVSIVSDVQQGIWFDNRTALPFGLMLTELFTNVYKHAFPPGFAQQATVRLSLSEQGDNIAFLFEDNGKGSEVPVQRRDSMGMLLINGLTRQLKGKVVLQQQHGYRYQFTFTKPDYAHINH